MKTIHDINFAELYKNHVQLATREPKQPQDWDRKAEQMQNSQFDLKNDYVQDFVSRMDLNNVDSMLDVGCGGGAIALACAPYVKRVYSLDYSQGMLNLLQLRSQLLELHNIFPILRAWDDDWKDVPVCDICVSSRSSMVNDLQAALDKLNAKAKKAVYMTMTVDKDFVDRKVLKFIHREGIGFPNYIYAVNMLYQQGYQVKVDFLDGGFGLFEPQTEKSAVISEQDFIRTVKWSIGSNLSEVEIAKLKDYYHQHKGNVNVRPAMKRWAFLSWKK
ncbi:class I SAM-dependent methyltransferase [Lonepinella sp. MS14437]|uniref:class I SAM-dependent methyltransferase n=1 Tax=unclassified Lonepinella TaxID=2642006 RepID=UPI0036D79B3B